MSKGMTWAEFKRFVDKQLKEQGINENKQIAWIDISYPDTSHVSTKPHVWVDNSIDMIVVS